MPDYKNTASLTPDVAGLARAASLLATGGLVAFPTETVYGLGGDARNDRAMARIFAAKGRPHRNPLIVHLPDVAAARALATLDETAERLADAFWPGPLTLVLPLSARAKISPLVTAGLTSVALRVPAHPVSQALLKAFGGPIAAPSANPSGQVSPTEAAHVLAGLGGRIEAVLDGGPCPVGLESTILALTPGAVRLLRPGGLPVEAIEACLGSALHNAGTNGTPTAPGGQPGGHYMPRARLRLGARRPRSGELWLGFGPDAAAADRNLSITGDLVEAAANLFGALHALDTRAGHGGTIAVSPIPECGLGRAINDRLRRAATHSHAPRSQA